MRRGEHEQPGSDKAAAAVSAAAEEDLPHLSGENGQSRRIDRASSPLFSPKWEGGRKRVLDGVDASMSMEV